MALLYVVLDLDNTLLYYTPVARCGLTEDKDSFLISDLKGQIFRILPRNHWRTLVEGLFADGYKVIVWSSGTDVYVKRICEILFGLDKLTYILTRSQLVDQRKKLTVIKEFVDDFEVERAVLIDDLPDYGADFPKRLLQVKPFYGTQDDELLGVLEQIRNFGKPTPKMPEKFGATFAD